MRATGQYNMRRSQRRIWRALVCLLMCSLMCSTVFAGGRSPKKSSADDLDSLLPLINQTLAKIKRRELRSDRHSPWVIMHGIIAFGQDFDVYDAVKRQKINAIEFLLNRATVQGQRIFNDNQGEPSLPSGPQQVLIQGHVDQYLMAFADAQVPLEYKLTADTGRTFTIADLLNATRRHFNASQELAYTLVALPAYMPLNQSWTTDSGQTFLIKDIVKLALYRDPRMETCNGTHHLYGIAYALMKHREQGEADDEVWRRAKDYVQSYIEQAKQYQQESGAFSGAGFRGAAPANTPRLMVETSGHTLEWLTMALTADELKEPWVRKAVRALCEEIQQYPLKKLSDSGMYHAAHALRRYREAVGTGSHIGNSSVQMRAAS